MEYVVLTSGGKQYKVTKGDVLEVDSLPTKEGTVSFDRVLLSVSDGNVVIGKPYIPDASVKATILSNKKGKKIRVAKYKAKVRYRKVIGFREHLTELRIDSIEIPQGKKVAEKKEKTEK